MPPFPVYGIMPKRNSMCQRKRGRFSEVRLSRSVLDAEGRPVVGEDGRREKETVTVTPAQIKEALSEARKRYSEQNARDGRGLSERAASARGAAESMERGGPARPFAREPR